MSSAFAMTAAIPASCTRFRPRGLSRTLSTTIIQTNISPDICTPGCTVPLATGITAGSSRGSGRQLSSRAVAADVKLEDLPLYATDKDLAVVILGERAAKMWPGIAKHFEGRGLPPIDSLFGGRYVPAVVKFFDAMNGVSGPGPGTYPTLLGPPYPSQDGKENPWPGRNRLKQS